MPNKRDSTFRSVFHRFLPLGLLMMSTLAEKASTALSPSQCNVRKRRSSGLLLIGLVCSALFSTGCSTLLGKTKGPMDNLDTKGLKQAGYTFGEYGAQKPITTEDGSPAIVLEVNNGKRHFEKIPFGTWAIAFYRRFDPRCKTSKEIWTHQGHHPSSQRKELAPSSIGCRFRRFGQERYGGAKLLAESGRPCGCQTGRSVYAGRHGS